MHGKVYTTLATKIGLANRAVCSDFHLRDCSSSWNSSCESVYRRMAASLALLFTVLLFGPIGTCADECKDVGTEHYFACSYYYHQLEDALTSDRNELFWLHRLFFPDHGQSPHTFWLTVKVDVDRVNPQICTYNDQHPAYFNDGAVWTGRWKFLVSTSTLLSFISPNVLFAFDNTISWGVHAMATGLESNELNEYSVGVRLQQLPCMPTRNIMTEVISTLISRVSTLCSI